MEYQIVISPTLTMSAAEFVSEWNETPACRQVAEAEVAEAEASATYNLDPALLQQGLIFLAGVMGGVTLEVIKELAKERLQLYLARTWPPPRPKVEVEAIPQPGQGYLLVIKEEA